MEQHSIETKSMIKEVLVRENLKHFRDEVAEFGRVRRGLNSGGRQKSLDLFDPKQYNSTSDA